MSAAGLLDSLRSFFLHERQTTQPDIWLAIMDLNDPFAGALPCWMIPNPLAPIDLDELYDLWQTLANHESKFFGELMKNMPIPGKKRWR